MKTAIIAITRNGARLGAKVADAISADCHVLRKYHGVAGKAALPFDDLRELVPRLWQEYRGLIFIMASGIVVRFIAPLLRGKDVDPAVVVMDEGARFSISLLSGHLGGANRLAEECAFATGARAVITTATDVNDLPSFDLLAKDEGWVIDDLSLVKTLNSLLLDDEPIAVVDPTGRVRTYFHGLCRLSFYGDFMAALQSGAKGFVFVTNRRLPPQVQCPKLLILRPQNLVLGIGCNSGTGCEEIEGVATSHLKRLFLSVKSVKCIATAEAKRHEPGLVAFAEKWGLPLVCFTSEQLNSIETPTPPSAHALAAIGAIGVAEPAALLASEGGNLLLRKAKDGNVTLAIAGIPGPVCERDE